MGKRWLADFARAAARVLAAAALAATVWCVLAQSEALAQTDASTPTGQFAQTFAAKVAKTTTTLNYLMYVPEKYPESTERWPLVLYLHGSGERGNNLENLKMNGLPKLVGREGKSFPFLIVSPQCVEEKSWSNDSQIVALSALLDDVTARYRVDLDRVYVTGISMGGLATWRLAADYPDRFAAIVPICGRTDPSRAARISKLPIWVFHGALDPIVPPENSTEMVAALKAAGSNVKFTLYPDAGHDCWTETYNNPELYQWLLEQKRPPQGKAKGERLKAKD